MNMKLRLQMGKQSRSAEEQRALSCLGYIDANLRKYHWLANCIYCRWACSLLTLYHDLLGTKSAEDRAYQDP